MPRYKPADTTQTLMVPVRAADQLLPGTFEHALNLIVDERIDLEELGRRWFCNDATGASAYHRKGMGGRRGSLRSCTLQLGPKGGSVLVAGDAIRAQPC